MRNIIVHVLATLDGVVGDPPSWGARDYRDEEGARDYLGEVLACDAMLMGRHGYETLQPTFSQRTDPWAARINAMPKYVFSSTLREAPWHNTKVVTGDALGEIAELKRAGGGDLLIYGYTQLAESLLRAGLVDLLRIELHPVLVGRGATLFRDGVAAKLALVGVKAYAKGVVMLAYRKT